MKYRSFKAIEGPYTQKVSKHLKEGGVKKRGESMKVGEGGVQRN
jgi:hypothetical protein